MDFIICSKSDGSASLCFSDSQGKTLGCIITPKDSICLLTEYIDKETVRSYKLDG